MDLIKDLDVCRAAVEQNPNSAGAFLDLAAALLREQMPEESVEACREAVRLNPEWADAHISLGFSSLVLRRADDARVAFETALRFDPSQPLAHYGLGQAFIFLGHREAALEQVKILQAFGDVPDVLIAHLLSAVEAVDSQAPG